MDVSIEKTGTFGRKLSVTLPSSAVDKAFDKAYRAVAKHARIPGFRPGKAPRNVLDMHYGAQVRSEVEQSLVTESLFQAIQQADESPVEMPNVEPGKLKRGDQFSYVAEFEVPPEVELTAWEGLSIERVETTIEDSEVEHELEHMREHAAELVPVDRDTVHKGDTVTMDYEGFIEKEPFPGGKGENAMIEIGGSDYIPGFSEGIEGAKLGDTVRFPVTFPEEYGAEQLASKEAEFEVTVKEIKLKELPELNDDFAKDMDADNLDALKESIRDRLLAKKKEDADEEQRTLALKALVEANPFELPQSMVRQQAQRMVREASQRMKQILGSQFELNAEQAESLAKENEKDAEFQVRSGLLLLEVSKAANIEIDDSKIDAEIEKIAVSAGDQAERVRAVYSNPDQRDRMRYKLVEDETIALLLEKGGVAAASKKEATKQEA